VAFRHYFGHSVSLDTFGWADHSSAPADIVDRHYQFDLNDAQDDSRWFPADPHDVIIMAEVIEHLYTAPQLVLSMLAEFLDQGGSLIIQTPNAVWVRRRLMLLRGRHPYEMIRERRDNPGHFREYTGDELLAACRAAGLVPHSLEFESYWTSTRIAERLATMTPQGRLLSPLYWSDCAIRLLESSSPRLRPGLVVVAEKL
jgi:hypothetical protein